MEDKNVVLYFMAQREGYLSFITKDVKQSCLGKKKSVTVKKDKKTKNEQKLMFS